MHTQLLDCGIESNSEEQDRHRSEHFSKLGLTSISKLGCFHSQCLFHTCPMTKLNTARHDNETARQVASSSCLAHYPIPTCPANTPAPRPRPLRLPFTAPTDSSLVCVSKEGLCPIWKGFLFQDPFWVCECRTWENTHKHKHRGNSRKQIQYMQNRRCAVARATSKKVPVPGVAGLPPGCVSGVVTRTAAAS